MPGAADDRDVLGLLVGGADRLAHVGLAALLGRVVLGERLAQRAHRLGHGLERVALAARLDDVLPPALGVPVAGDLGERGQRVRAQAAARLVLVAARGHLVRRGQVHEAHGHVAVERVADRPPLGREAGERIERGAGGLVRHVGEQRDGRRHVLARGELEQRVGLRRPFDQDGVGLELVQRALK